MKLKQWKDYGYKDSKKIQKELEEQKAQKEKADA